MAEATACVTVAFLQNGIAVIRMQRGENRINNEFLDAFNNCLDTVQNTPSCKGLITTGEGKFYSNGLDTDWLETVDGDVMTDFYRRFQHMLQRLLTFPVPTVAAINGHCFAGGALIAFANDLRVMNSQRGWLCFNEVLIKRRIGQFSIRYLKAKISPASTFHKALVFGQRFTGPEAKSVGMVDSTVPPALVQQESQRLLASFIGKNGFHPESLQVMKMDIYGDAVKEFQQSKL